MFLTAKRLGHSVKMLEDRYVDALVLAPARTIEDAAGIRAECEAIARAVGAVVPASTTEAVAQ